MFIYLNSKNLDSNGYIHFPNGVDTGTYRLAYATIANTKFTIDSSNDRFDLIDINGLKSVTLTHGYYDENTIITALQSALGNDYVVILNENEFKIKISSNNAFQLDFTSSMIHYVLGYDKEITTVNTEHISSRTITLNNILSYNITINHDSGNYQNGNRFENTFVIPVTGNILEYTTYSVYKNWDQKYNHRSRSDKMYIKITDDDNNEIENSVYLIILEKI